MGERPGPRSIAVIGGVALLLRLAWVLAVDRTGFAFNDAIMYHSTAESLVRGDGYVPFTGGPTARWPPGYATLLAGTYLVTGVEPVAGEIVNALLGAIGAVVLALAAARAFGARVGLVAGLMFAALPGPILWTDVLVSETLFTTLFVVVVALVLRADPTWRWAAGLGVVIGVGALVRGEAFTWLLLPIVAWWSLVPRVQLVRLAVVAIATTALAIAPWTIRNAVVMDAFVPVATNASQTLWSGHHAGATGAQTYPPDDLLDRFDGGPAERELAASRALRNDAIEYAVTHPIDEVRLIPLKIVHLLRGDSYALDWVNAGQEGRPPPLSPIWVERIGVVADAGWFGLLALTIVGGSALGRRWWRQPFGRLAATAFATALFLYGFAYYGNYRYRLAYEPLMVVVVAAFLVRLHQWRESDSAIRE